MTKLKSTFFKYILFILLLVFASTTNSVLALEQLKAIGTAANWRTRNGMNGNNNLIIDYPNTNYIDLYYNTKNRTGAGMAYQTVTTPAGTVNASYYLQYQRYRNNRTPNRFDAYCYLGTDNTRYDETTQIFSGGGNYEVTNSTTNTTTSNTAEGTINNLNANTTYYFKVYLICGFANNNTPRAGFKVFNARLNFSPSGLAGRLAYNGNVINGIYLSWNQSTSNAVTCTNYKIYRSNSENGTYTLIQTNNQNTRNYTDTTPLSGDNWYYITDVGSDGVESPASIKVRVDYPAAASNLNGTLSFDGSNMHHVLSWTAAPGYSGQYVIRRGTTSGNYTQNIEGANLPSKEDYLTLNDNTTYYYVVSYMQWYDGANRYYPYSAEYSKYVLYPPTWPGYEAVVPYYDSASDKDCLVLKWNGKGFAVQNYKIYRSTSENGTYELIATLPNGTTTYTDNTVNSTNTYYYKITCTTANGESPYSDIKSGKAAARPTNLVATVNAQRHPILTWSDPVPPNASPSQYSIYRSTVSADGPFTRVVEWTNENPYTDNGITLAEGEVCYYYVAERWGGSGISGPSNIAAASVIFPPTINISVLSDLSGLTLSWTYATSQCPEARLGGYNVYRSTTSGGPYTLIGQTNGKTGVSFTDTTVENNVTYYYVVRTRNTSGSESANSNERNGKVNLQAPLLPPTISATLLSNRYLPVTINIANNYDCYPIPASAFGGFNIYRKTAEETEFTKIATIASTTFTYDDLLATPEIVNEYYVTAFNRLGAESPQSNRVSKTPESIITLVVSKNLPDPIDLSATSSNIGSVDVSWSAIVADGTGAAITGYKVSILRDGAEICSDIVSDPNANSHTVNNVFFVNNANYIAYVEATYTLNGISNVIYDYSNSFTVVTPQMTEVRDGWSGKDIAYSFFDNLAEANWSFANDANAVRYEVALGTTPYGNDTVDWTDVGIVNRVSLPTPQLASGTRYYFSVRGFNQQKYQVVSGCSDGFVARKDVVYKDTSAYEFFNNARVLDNLDTINGQLAPTTAASGNQYKYCRSVTITEPDITDRVNAPCLIDFTIPAGQRPANVREFRVLDDQGNICRRFNLTTPNNSTVDHPYIVFLVSMPKGSTRTYYVYWGSNQLDEVAQGFSDNTDENCLNGWTPYYSRKDMPAGIESVSTAKAHRITNASGGLVGDDLSIRIRNTFRQSGLSRFKFFGTDRSTTRWHLTSNGVLARRGTTGNANTDDTTERRTSSSDYSNTLNEFKSNGNGWGWLITPIWIDHRTNNISDDYSGKAPADSGVFEDHYTNPNRLLYTWVTNNYSYTDDIYRFQAVLYETGDIALRYEYLSTIGLYGPAGTGKPVNATERTCGISNGDNSKWLINAPLIMGINKNPTAFYQCMNAFEDTIEYGPILGDGTSYDIAHFQSMVFDTKVASPKWIGMEYDVTVTGARKLLIAYRTGDTPLPDNTWSAWSTSTEVTSSVTDGFIAFPASTSGRYIQYRADFMKTSTADGSISVQEVRFQFGGISVESVTSFIDGNAVTEVSRGQRNIPVKVAVKNLSADTVSLTENELLFSVGGHTAALSPETTFPIAIESQKIATLSYLVNVADDAPLGECVIDDYATASALIYDNGAQIPLRWTVKSETVLVVKDVHSAYTKVTKGFDYDIYVTIENTGESPCYLNDIFLTYASGTYSFTLDPTYGLATGTVPTTNNTIAGNSTKTAKYIVHISNESASGSDTIGATASATNKLSGNKIEALDTDNPHIWTIQKPAELNLYNITAPSTLYRGQKNNKITITATNEGEADLDWFPGSSTSKIVFTPITNGSKSYENLKIITAEPSIIIDSATVAQAEYSVDVKQDTATGTDQITTTIYGMEENTKTALVDASVDGIPSAEWTIYSEKVNTYSDGPCNEESDSFNKPSGSSILNVYAKVENLAGNTEYMVHWYDSAGTEILTTKPKITAGQGYFIVQLDLDSTCLSGTYKIAVTDPLSLYVCCENLFNIVAPAEMTASFTMPLYATVGQPIVASFTYINEGGAEITNATLIPTSTVQINSVSGGGNVTFNPDNPEEAIFDPRLSDVPGNGQATAIFKLIAAHTGRVSLTGSATGFDKNSGMSLSCNNITSNECTIQETPNIVFTNVTLSATNVYRNQKNLRITATIKNDGAGRATGVVTAASFTANIGTYEQELMGYTEPFEIVLGANETKTLTFDVSVDVDSATGLDTINIRALWHDQNWPESGDRVAVSGNAQWTIREIGMILTSDLDHNYVRSDFCPGQKVNILAFNLTPDTSYYRIRIYNTQITTNYNNQIPTGEVSYSPLIVPQDNGEGEHNYDLPDNARIGTWTVVVDYTESTSYATRGALRAIQYFRVQSEPSLRAVLTIDDSEDVFVGDQFNVTLTISSDDINGASVDEIKPYDLIKDATSFGNAKLISGPEPATFTLRAGEAKTFNYVFEATQFSNTGKFRLKSSDAAHIAGGFNRNLWESDHDTDYDVFANQVTSNGITIYEKSMGISPTTIDFGNLDPKSEDKRFGLVCGAMQELNVTVLKTGNYDLDNISVNKSFLNGPVVDGVKETISDTYFDIDTAAISNPMTAASQMTRASLSVPFFKPQGEYTSTMFVYCDTNGNGKFDSGEITAEFDVKVWVNLCKIIKVEDDDKVVDMGSWPKGATTKEETVDFFSGGNINLTNVKIVPETVSSLTPYITFTNPTQMGGAYPLRVGAIPVKEYRKANFYVTLPADAAQGTYSATFKIFEDTNNNDIHDPLETGDPATSNTESYDTFTVKVTVGDVRFTITPGTLRAVPLETSMTAITGVVPGFSRLTITNTSTGGMELSRIKLSKTAINGIDALGNHYTMGSDTIEIYPGSLQSPLANGDSDVFDIEIFIAAGTDSATYTTTLQFYSDDNGDSILNGGEYHVDIPLEFYVKPTEKVEVIDKPVAITGMSSDVRDTFAQVEFLCYNLGNVPLKALKFETNQLVQKDVTTPVTIPMNPSFFELPSNPYEAPKKTQFSVKLTIPVPMGTPDGVYITTALCSIYNDDGGDYEHPEAPDGALDKLKECYDEFQVWLQIGEMKIIINNANNINGKPGERSTQGSFSVKNDGALTVTSIIASATALTKGIDTIPATASVILPSENVGTLKAGMEQTRQWAVDIPDCTPAGVYTGNILVWSDTNGNKILDVGEASATREVKLTVEACPKLSIREDSISPVDITTLATPLVTNNATVNVTVRLYNTGNQNITGSILPVISDLHRLSDTMEASVISVSVESFTTLQPYTVSGQYVLATVTVHLGPELRNSGHYTGPLEFYVAGRPEIKDSVTLDVEYGIKDMSIVPNPLVFDDLEHVIKQKVTATKRSAASLKRICAWESGPAVGCGATTISLETAIPQEITGSKDFYFQVNLDPNTAPGTYIATWTFFDDDDMDGLYDVGEYAVDLQIHYVVPERIDLEIIPDVREVPFVLGSDELSRDIQYTVVNKGNAPLDNTQLVWRLPPAALVDAEGHTLPQSCFSFIETPITPIPAGETGTYTIRITIPDTQEVGVYGPANMGLEYNLTLMDTTAITVIVEEGGPSVIVPPSTVHQLVATTTWDLNPPNVFFVSAWVCPGLPDAPDKTYANLSMVRYNEDGSPNAALSVRIDNKTRQVQINDVGGLLPEYPVFKDNPSYEDTIRQTDKFKFHEVGGKPVCGISGDPVTAKDEATGNTLLFYRVYFAFEVEPSATYDPLGSDPTNLLGTEKVRILLSESKESETASSTVYFDGIKLEKAIKPDQDRPTTYHQGTTLVSPSNALDVSGKHKYYEW